MSPRCPIFSTSWVSITCTGLPPDHVGQQGHLAGALDGRGRLALVLRAEARDPSRTDLAAVRDEPAQHIVVLVVDVGDVFLAEDARLALYRPAPAGRPSPSPTHSLPPERLVRPGLLPAPRPAAACASSSAAASLLCGAARRPRRAGTAWRPGGGRRP